MKDYCILIIVLFTSCNRVNTEVENNKSSKLRIEINKNIELLGFGYFIGFEGLNIENKTVEVNGEIIPKKEWHNFGYSFYEKYKSFASNENAIKSFAIADHLWLDYLIAFLLQVEEFPNAKLPETLDASYYINFSKDKNMAEAKLNATAFLDWLNKFYEEVNFDSFLSQSKPYYNKIIEEVTNAIPNATFIAEMEMFYQKRYDSYVLIPSLTIPKSMGFGIRMLEKDSSRVFNVFGALDFQEFNNIKKLKMGFNHPKKLRELSVHEFGHSFVNPEIFKLPDSLFANTKALFLSIKDNIYKQGYNTWKACVYEHFVRSGEIIIAERMGNLQTAKQLQLDYEIQRDFKYIPIILPELRKYNEGVYKTYSETIKNTMIKMSNLK
ncbi:DUF4932 domain-containing protein [Flavobacteriaceae bacterium AU392]|nr:DUF4932 domain-containing protein [Flavobacteriaceae bacterium]RKM83564.1 DUF4932 domain-containing protein [Flavobacteriaceae bacterium AU392]